jgi:hypothetical protein
MVVDVQTTATYGNVGTHYSQTFAALLLESGGIYTITIDGKSSELTETSPGVWEPSTDGYVRVSVNGTEIFSFDGPVWHGESSTNRNWNSVTFHPIGKFTDLQIFDEVCETVSPPCECVEPPTVTPEFPPPIPTHPPKVEPTIGEQLACVGGGRVPMQPDLVYIENWWGM